jgi:hypothetical protein
VKYIYFHSDYSDSGCIIVEADWSRKKALDLVCCTPYSLLCWGDGIVLEEVGKLDEIDADIFEARCRRDAFNTIHAGYQCPHGRNHGCEPWMIRDQRPVKHVVLGKDVETLAEAVERAKQDRVFFHHIIVPPEHEEKP